MAPDEETIPHYVYAAAMAVRSLELNMWAWSRQERTRVILASLDALPLLPDGVDYVPGDCDWLEHIPELDRADAYADAFNAALEVAEEIVIEQQERRRARTRRRRA